MKNEYVYLGQMGIQEYEKNDNVGTQSEKPKGLRATNVTQISKRITGLLESDTYRGNHVGIFYGVSRRIVAA